MTNRLTLSSFAGRVGEEFVIRLPDAKLSVTLIEVADHGPGSGWARGRPESARQGERFVVLFQGRHAPPLPQRLYDFEHPALGAFSLFIVPVGAGAEGVRYEAVFNRLLDDRHVT